MSALEDLIDRLEREGGGTPGTPAESHGVPRKPAETLGGTPGTPGTPENQCARGRSGLAADLRAVATDLREIAAEIRARDILRHAELAAPRPDLDPAEWQGEYEADPAPGEVGDLGESEHDAWLAGVPIRKLEAASPVSSKTALESFDER
jgi:hypothetical protein